MDIKKLRKDSAGIASGLWVAIPQLGNLRLKVRGWNAREVARFRTSLERAAWTDPANLEESGSELLFDVSYSITARVLLEKVLVGWDGLEDDGEAVPYSYELATQLLTDPDFEDFQNACAWASQQVSIGNGKRDEELVGNSDEPSAGPV